MKMILTLMLSAGLVLGAISAATAADVKPYPKKTCLVTDNKLGSMGTPVKRIYGGQEVKFCCKPCVAKFEKTPERFLAKLSK